MTELALILVSAILVNNFVLVQFLGLCPFMGVSRKIETAIGLSLATTFVLTLAAMCSHILQRYVLRPLDLEYLRTIGFILVIAVVVQFTEMLVKKTSPLLYRVHRAAAGALKPTSRALARASAMDHGSWRRLRLTGLPCQTAKVR